LNTCHIREKAAEKVYSELGRLARLKRTRAAEGRRLMIAVAGCVAQAEGEEVLRRAPAVDIVLGPQAYHRLPELCTGARHRGRFDTDFPLEASSTACPRSWRALRRSAFLTVQESWQILHVLRGAVPEAPGVAPRSCDLAEARRLVDAGARITL
jgi:tRNA-2-methylthio-N6-dimethylallyladenosine synthase